METQDGGDVKGEVSPRDIVYTQAAGGEEDPNIFHMLDLRFEGISWHDDSLALIYEDSYSDPCRGELLMGLIRKHEIIKGYEGEPDNSGNCEQIFLELMKVPRSEAKLIVYSYKLQFSTQVSELRDKLNIVYLSVEQISRNCNRIWLNLVRVSREKRLIAVGPSKLVPALKEGTTSPAAFTRATVVVAVKYSIVERPKKIDAVLYPEISSFLMLIKDQDRGKLPGGKEIAVKRQYGTRESKEVTLERRVQFDLLQAMQRDYKLSSYSLNSVSTHFFNEQKFLAPLARGDQLIKSNLLNNSILLKQTIEVAPTSFTLTGASPSPPISDMLIGSSIEPIEHRITTVCFGSLRFPLPCFLIWSPSLPHPIYLTPVKKRLLRTTLMELSVDCFFVMISAMKQQHTLVLLMVMVQRRWLMWWLRLIVDCYLLNNPPPNAIDIDTNCFRLLPSTADFLFGLDVPPVEMKLRIALPPLV
ncbi:unnamed protein product [Lactuca saligna]|uniref:DNA-directed DNA polymerase family B exonuclease domain-containing protein n=1 Tax=Lactuca saligna TaxID=75948 RepID=A0AA35YV63_LACSI|nr:unnamed protein product [Lactuca saligna]